MYYYINEERKKRNTAGAKAPRDISEICEKLGMKRFPMPQFPSDKGTVYQKIWLAIVCPFYWMKLWITVKKGDVVLYQHPMYGNRVAAFFIPIIQKRKDCKFIAVIHDLESLRKGIAGVIKRSQKTNEVADNQLLKEFDIIICHNEHMKQYLISQGFDAGKLVCLGVFDYLCDHTDRKTARGKDPSIAIAGNLAPGKCGYIYDILKQQDGENADLTLHLYGEYFDKSKASGNMIYHGSYPPEELPLHLEGDFGLVWDGTSAETCAGNTGEYLKYNDPHKTSLYLAGGMPVIVWDQAAIADFVSENGVGITVASLEGLDRVISDLTDEEYKHMCENVVEIGKKIRSGWYFQTALKKCLQILGDTGSSF